MADQSRNLLFTVAIVLIGFTSFGNGTYEECLTTLRNTVVYEGTLDTLFSCANGPNSTAWLVRPTSNAVNSFQITNYNDTVSPTLTTLYAFNGTGLTVRNATTLPTGGPISTAGFYIVSFNATTRIAFKLVVIRSGPICSCIQSSSVDVISCTMIYADHPARGSEINAVMNCTANDGQFYASTTPTKTLLPYIPPQYVWNSTSTITVNNAFPVTYDCLVTFAAPPYAVPPYLAQNAPDFNATSTVFCGSTTTAPPTTTTQTTTSLPTTSSMEQTVPTQQMPGSPPILLSVDVVLSVVLGCLFLTTVVCWCWCCRFCPGFCRRRFRRRPRYIHVAKELVAADYVFWRRRYILRFTGNSFRRNQLIY